MTATPQTAILTHPTRIVLEDQTMRSIKRLLVVVATMPPSPSPVPSASAGTHKSRSTSTRPAPNTDRAPRVRLHRPALRLQVVPARHQGPLRQPERGRGMSSRPHIGIKNGSTDGECVWSSPVNAVCTFGRGTGRLTQFHLAVAVTANADASVWYWDGTYWFGRAAEGEGATSQEPAGGVATPRFPAPPTCPGSAVGEDVVEMRGLEPLTPAMRTRCSSS